MTLGRVGATPTESVCGLWRRNAFLLLKSLLRWRFTKRQVIYVLPRKECSWNDQTDFDRQSAAKLKTAFRTSVHGWGTLAGLCSGAHWLGCVRWDEFRSIPHGSSKDFVGSTVKFNPGFRIYSGSATDDSGVIWSALGRSFLMTWSRSFALSAHSATATELADIVLTTVSDRWLTPVSVLFPGYSAPWGLFLLLFRILLLSTILGQSGSHVTSLSTTS